ncbi:MAG: hypothetical protein ACK518_00510 [bacterium]
MAPIKKLFNAVELFLLKSIYKHGFHIIRTTGQQANKPTKSLKH